MDVGYADTFSASTRLTAWAQWIEARALPLLPRHLTALTKQSFQDKNIIRVAHPFRPRLLVASTRLMACAQWIEHEYMNI